MLGLRITKSNDSKLLELMRIHYSQPNGIVGRRICYSIYCNDIYYGHIVGGSATLNLPGRKEIIGNTPLTSIINNIFYHVSKVDDCYPLRNFTTKVVSLWRNQISKDWEERYGDKVLFFETLVELPRTGELYRKDGWTEIGITKGMTCKRVAGNPTEKWTGVRIWDRINLRPKRVFIRKVEADV